MATFRITYDAKNQAGSLTHQQAGDAILDDWYDADASDEEREIHEVEVEDQAAGWYEQQLDDNPAVLSYEKK